MKAKKVLLLSSGQPSLNPRLVKEADALAGAGYEVTVLYAYWNHWGTVHDQALLATKKWKAVRVGGDPQQKSFTYTLSRFIYKTARYFAGKGIITDAVAGRASWHLLQAVKKHKADICIGHNFGALPATIAAAKRFKAPCGFDAEDFHRNEVSNDANNPDVIIKSAIENKYLPQLNYFTTSSPQIADAYQRIYPTLKPVVLLNVFPKTDYKIVNRKQNGAVKLFWFSQTIGNNRGIGDIVNALKRLPLNNFELHLLGNRCSGNENFINDILDSGITVNFYDPLPSDQLVSFAAQFDIGLASEPGFSINNHLALSNKIFTYMQSGLAIIASNTTAQQALMNDNPAIGRVYPIGNPEALATILTNYYLNRDALLLAQQSSATLAHTKYNWETESDIFLKLVAETIEAHR